MIFTPLSLRPFIISTIALVLIGSKPAVGSSNNTNLFSIATTDAIATLFF